MCAPYCDLSISSRGCSMRTPAAKGFGKSSMPQSSKSSYVSLPPWPAAIMSAQHGILSVPFLVSTIAPDILSPSRSMPQSLVSKRTSAPSVIAACLMFFTVSISLSVPICGFAIMRISSGAPNRASRSITSLDRGSFILVVSLPSENVPAPPSPNMTLLFGFSLALCQKSWTSFRRSSTHLPRSITIGL